MWVLLKHMTYNDTTNLQGIMQAVESIVFNEYGKISTNPERKQTFTRHCNSAMDHISSIVLSNDNTWEFDDTNSTDFPIGYTDMADGLSDYSLPNAYLKMLGVSIKDKTGLWVKLRQISPEDMNGQDRDEFMKIPSQPIYYDIIGSSIVLYPAPALQNVTLTQGLKVYSQRAMQYFTSTDTTKEPGFPSIYHRLVVLWTAYYYCQENSIQKTKPLLEEIQMMELDLKKYYSLRNKTRKPRVTMGHVDSR